jgi:hypothetical protein
VPTSSVDFVASVSNGVKTTPFSVTVRTFYVLTPLANQNSALCCFEKCRLVPNGEAKAQTTFATKMAVAIKLQQPHEEKHQKIVKCKLSCKL